MVARGRHRARLRLAGLLVAAAGLPCGCGTPGRAMPETSALTDASGLRVTHQAGGTHYRCVVVDGVWYQAFNSDLLTLDPEDGSVQDRLSLGPPGFTPPATDLVLHGGSLYAVLDEAGVVEIALPPDGAPHIVRQTNARDLGIRPRHLSVAGSEVYVSGLGGAVRLSDGAVVFGHEGDVTSLARTGQHLVATAGRRVYHADDHTYLGSASDLLGLEPDRWGEASVVFLRRGERLDSVGLMTADLRELDHDRLTITSRRPVQRARVLDDRIWILSDEEVRAYLLRAGTLHLAARIDVAGVLDLDIIDADRLALCGTFGRGIYRRWEQDGSPGRRFEHVHRVPAGLTRASFDGRHVLAASPHGNWLYTPGSEPVMVDEAPPADAAPADSAVTLWGSACITRRGQALDIVSPDGSEAFRETDGSRIHCVAAVNGQIWLGHDTGVAVLGDTASTRATVVARVYLGGPVRYLFPLPEGGSAAFVSESAGFGVVRLSELE